MGFYREKTAEQIKRSRRNTIISIVAIIVIIVCAVYIFLNVQANLREQGAASVRDAVLQAADQCCAVEGSYPSSLAYLENHYGLKVNESDYLITYEVYASNIQPSVTVVPR